MAERADGLDVHVVLGLVSKEVVVLVSPLSAEVRAVHARKLVWVYESTGAERVGDLVSCALMVGIA
jgi:hypothetical protein